MPGKGKRRNSADFSDSDNGQGGVTYEVYNSEAMTFHKNGEFGRAISSYTKVKCRIYVCKKVGSRFWAKIA